MNLHAEQKRIQELEDAVQRLELQLALMTAARDRLMVVADRLLERCAGRMAEERYHETNKEIAECGRVGASR